MHLHELYKAILASLNVVAGEDDLLSLQYGDKSFPATVEGKRLVIPSPTILRGGLGDKLIAFHPLSENVLRGESPILKKLKVYVTNKLTQTLSDLLVAFVEIAANHKAHGKLTPPQKDLLLALPDADEKTVALLGDIYDAMAEDSKRKLLTIYLKRGGTLRMERYSRTAVVSFPIMREFENDDRTVYGVKCRKADYAGLAKLFDYVLPNGDGAGYSAGSNDQDVPYFDALISAYVKVATQLNSLITLFKKQLPNPEELMIDLSWVPATLDWRKYRDLIPVLAGNDGVTAAEEQPDEPAPAPVHRGYDPTRAAAAAASSAPSHTAHPAATAAGTVSAPATAEVRKTDAGLNWQDIAAAQQRRLLQPVQPVPPPGFGYPAPPTAVPMGYQQVMTDPWGRPMQPGMVPPPNMMPNPGYMMEPPPPGFGPPPGQPMLDQWGRPVYPGIPPGYGGPAMAYPNNRQPSFGPGAPNMVGATNPGSRQPSFGPNAVSMPPQYVDQWGRPVMTAAPPGQAGVMPYPPGYMQPAQVYQGGNVYGNAAAIPVYGR